MPLLPRLNPATGDEVDMSMCWLRSMSPLHLQYLRNMGAYVVTLRVNDLITNIALSDDAAPTFSTVGTS